MLGGVNGERSVRTAGEGRPQVIDYWDMRKRVTLYRLLAAQVSGMITFAAPMKHSEKLHELDRRRRLGARVLVAGRPQAEVARRVGVSRQTVMRWERLRHKGGVEALRRAEHFGRPERLSQTQREERVRLLKTGSLAAGFATE